MPLLAALLGLVVISAASAEDQGLTARLGFAGSGLAVLSWEADRPTLPAAGGELGPSFELAWGRWIPLRLSADFYWTGQSRMDESLFLYRAFNGGRLTAMTGFRLFLGPAELGFLGGGSISTSNYTGTTLASAYYSLDAEARVLYPLGVRELPGLLLEAAIPVEYLFRGAASSVATGLSLGLAIPVGARGVK